MQTSLLFFNWTFFQQKLVLKIRCSCAGLPFSDVGVLNGRWECWWFTEHIYVSTLPQQLTQRDMELKICFQWTCSVVQIQWALAVRRQMGERSVMPAWSPEQCLSAALCALRALPLQGWPITAPTGCAGFGQPLPRQPLFTVMWFFWLVSSHLCVTTYLLLARWKYSLLWKTAGSLTSSSCCKFLTSSSSSKAAQRDVGIDHLKYSAMQSE